MIKRLLLILILVSSLGFIYAAKLALASVSAAEPYIATAYSLRGKTASGMRTRRGIVAADTRIHKLGSIIHVSSGSYTGNYIVADRGHAIHGRRIDIFMPSTAEALKFGKKKVYVSKVTR